jgi:hypothetical protein
MRIRAVSAFGGTKYLKVKSSSGDLATGKTCLATNITRGRSFTSYNSMSSVHTSANSSCAATWLFGRISAPSPDWERRPLNTGMRMASQKYFWCHWTKSGDRELESPNSYFMSRHTK